VDLDVVLGDGDAAFKARIAICGDLHWHVAKAAKLRKGADSTGKPDGKSRQKTYSHSNLAGYFARPRWQEKNNLRCINRFSEENSGHFVTEFWRVLSGKLPLANRSMVRKVLGA
jgi:hypothetical protein